MITGVKGAPHWCNDEYIRDCCHRYCEQLAESALSDGGWLALGNSPVGVDAWLLDAARALSAVDRCIALGWRRTARNPLVEQYMNFTFTGDTPARFQTPMDAARGLVDLSDRVVCIWNGVDDDVMATYQYAQREGVPAELVHIAKGLPCAS